MARRHACFRYMSTLLPQSFNQGVTVKGVITKRVETHCQVPVGVEAAQFLGTYLVLLPPQCVCVLFMAKRWWVALSYDSTTRLVKSSKHLF